MNKKRTLLSLLLLIITFSVSAYAFENDDSAADFLVGFGVMDAKDIEDSSSVMTRGQFVKLAAGIAVSYEIDYKDSEPKFADVQKNSDLYNSVMLLSDFDVINGVSAIEFAPERNISYSEACAVLVRILGYDFLAQKSSYEAMASDIGILDGVTTVSGELTAENAYRMVRNALFAEVKYGNKIDGFPTEFYPAPLMEMRFGIQEISGIVTDDGITGITQKTQVGAGNIMIGNMSFVNKSGKNDLLGCNVRAYWKEENYENVLVYAYIPENKNDVVVIQDTDINSFDKGVYTVSISETDSKTKKYTLESDYKVIYNGRPLIGGIDPSLMDELMCPSSGTVKLIDNNSDKKYEIVIIENYYTIAVRGYQSTTKTVFNALDVPAPENILDPQQSICFEDVLDLDVVTASGSKTSLDVIAKNNILSVMMSIDKMYAKVIISTQTESGNFTLSEDSGRYITVGDTVYETGEDVREYMRIPNIGGIVTVYLRHDGKVVYVDNGSSIDGTLSYLHKIYYDENTESAGVNMFTVEKEVKKTVLAKNVVIDGEMFKTARSAYDYILANPYAINGLVIVDFNETGEIARMDTAYYEYGEQAPYTANSNEEEKSIHIMKDKYQVSSSPTTWISSSGYVDEYTKIFVIPCELTENITQMNQVDISKINIDEINVTNSWSTAVTESNSLHTRYTIDDDSLYTDAIIVYKNTTGIDLYKSTDALRTNNVIITEINQAVNADNELCWQLWYTTGANPSRAYTKTLNGIKCMKSGETVQVGDIVKFATDKDGMIPDGQLVIMYSPATDPDNLLYENGNFANLSYNSADIGQWDFVLLKGQVDMMNDRFVRIIRTTYSNGVPSQNEVILQRAKMQYIVYEDGKVDFADGSYIETVKDLGSAANEVVFNWTEGNITYAYIVR